MKKIVYTMCVLMTLTLMIGVGQAQDRRQKGHFERVESEKIAFITKELQLTPKEAQLFFPSYNLYRDEIIKVLHSAKSQNVTNTRHNKRMDELAKESALLNIKKKYWEKFSAIIGESRASRFFEAEREFREKLINELKRRGNGDGNRGRNGAPKYEPAVQ